MAEIYATIFATPVLAFLFRRKWALATGILFTVTTIFVFAAFSALWLDVSFVEIKANILFLCATYLFVGLCVFRLPQYQYLLIKLIGVIGITIFIVFPFVSVLALLGVAFILSDLEELHSEVHPGNLVCRVTSYGNATTSTGGYKATIYRNFGLVEHEISSSQFETTGQLDIVPKTACTMALQKVKAN